MAYPGEKENLEYLRYVEDWSLGKGDYANEPKMSKDEWRKRMRNEEEGAEEKPEPTKPRGGRSSTILGVN